MLSIYNSLSRSKETLKPLESGKLGVYVCGMTVYDYCHIGHARILVAFDVIVRYLQHLGIEVNYVRNITDIDDKIIARAQKNNESWQQLTGRFIEAMHEDARTLGVLEPNHEPKATDHIETMLDMIESLLEKEMAYVASNGDVYYSVEKFAKYGKLSGKVLDDLIAGARVEVNKEKRSPLDFVLWKSAKPGEPAWYSPWGQGRPGWHIECSAMSKALLGAHFDIHGGGPDLKFPHHENEIAQSEAANCCEFANLWMHAGAVRVDNEKMSKSLGNFFTIREVLAEYPAEVVRYFLLASHYRSPINYSQASLQEAKASLERLYTALSHLPLDDVDTEVQSNQFSQRFNQVMSDDFNTPEALAVLFELAKQINVLKANDSNKAASLALQMKSLGKILGLLQDKPEAFLKAGVKLDAVYIEEQIEQRKAAKKAGDYALADTIRQDLAKQGVVLEDSRQGTSWRFDG